MLTVTRSRLVLTGMVPLLLLAVLPVLLSGCTSLRPPSEIHYASGAAVGSLSSNASLTYKASGRNTSGSGYLMYKKPDHLRMVILSPFGSVLQEVFVSGEQVTIIDSGNGVAFSGSYMELPDKGDLSGWRYIYWLIDIDPSDNSRGTATIERINRFGEPEKASFENGLLLSKQSATSGRVTYGRYTAVEGTAFPLEITYETAAREKFIILLEDPEINVPFAGDAFTPKLDNVRVYPLSALK